MTRDELLELVAEVQEHQSELEAVEVKAARGGTPEQWLRKATALAKPQVPGGLGACLASPMKRKKGAAMGQPSEPRRVRIDELHVDPDLTPKDDRLTHLMQEAFEGRVPVYRAEVPLALCVPGDLDCRPDLHPAGEAAIRLAMENWRQQKFAFLLVYPRGVWFVVSDDYPALFACLRGLPEYVPCWVLGKPDNPFVKNVQGPICQGDVRRILIGS